jgi:hypothetical protein
MDNTCRQADTQPCMSSALHMSRVQFASHAERRQVVASEVRWRQRRQATNYACPSSWPAMPAAMMALKASMHCCEAHGPLLASGSPMAACAAGDGVRAAHGCVLCCISHMNSQSLPSWPPLLISLCPKALLVCCDMCQPQKGLAEERRRLQATRNNPG